MGIFRKKTQNELNEMMFDNLKELETLNDVKEIKNTFKKIKRVLKKGADINAKNPQTGNTPLIQGIKTHNKPLIDFLLSNGADPEAVSYTQQTPLHAAASNGMNTVIEQLLNAGADINRKASNKMESPLNAAVSNHNTETCQLLLSKGADDKNSALLTACGLGNLKIAQILTEAGANVNYATADGFTPLMATAYYDAQYNNTAVAEYLINQKADINVPDKNGRTALSWAVTSDAPFLTALLFKYHADVNYADQDGVSPLMKAAAGIPHLVKPLLENGARTEDKDKNGRTALIYAVLHNNSEAVLTLMKHGAQIDETDHDGQTALTYAIEKDYLGLTKEILNFNASTQTAKKQHKKAFQLALKKNRLNIARMIFRQTKEKYFANKKIRKTDEMLKGKEIAQMRAQLLKRTNEK